jgi:hypothetical protein
VPPSLVAYDGDVPKPCLNKEEAGVSVFVPRVARRDNVDVLVCGARGLVVEVGDGQVYPLTSARVGRGEKEVESSVTAKTATLLSRDSELLEAQVEFA